MYEVSTAHREICISVGVGDCTRTGSFAPIAIVQTNDNAETLIAPLCVVFAAVIVGFTSDGFGEANPSWATTHEVSTFRIMNTMYELTHCEPPLLLELC